jgi:hypothetical protein
MKSLCSRNIQNGIKSGVKEDRIIVTFWWWNVVNKNFTKLTQGLT